MTSAEYIANSEPSCRASYFVRTPDLLAEIISVLDPFEDANPCWNHVGWLMVSAPVADYPGLHTYDILEPNEDAGKPFVCYSGEFLSVARDLDGETEACLIAACPELRSALQELTQKWEEHLSLLPFEGHTKAHQTLLKAQYALWKSGLFA